VHQRIPTINGTQLLIGVGYLLASLLIGIFATTMFLLVAPGPNVRLIGGTTIAVLCILSYVRLVAWHEQREYSELTLRGKCLGFAVILAITILFQGLIFVAGVFLVGLDESTLLSPFWGNASFDSAQILSMVLSAGLVAPILEEIFCRGLVLRFLLTRAGPLVAIGLQAAVFLLMHAIVLFDAQASRFVQLFLTGVFFGVLFYKSGSLVLAIVVHSAWNFVTILLILALASMPTVAANELSLDEQKIANSIRSVECIALAIGSIFLWKYEFKGME
jgi:hypothetical protein